MTQCSACANGGIFQIGSVSIGMCSTYRCILTYFLSVNILDMCIVVYGSLVKTVIEHMVGYRGHENAERESVGE